ncbi:MAG: DUF3137 domain-containing protein [Clostridia bacterium]|nr:DUF3137 domain-containing protein [bacterium]MBR4110262.1 DUF3137 domain-containing protein [Clostridia bacterium]
MKGILTLILIFAIMGLTFYISLNFTDYAMMIFNGVIVVLSLFVILWCIYQFFPKKYTRNIKKNMFSEKFESIYKNVCNLFRWEIGKIKTSNLICMFIIIASLVSVVYMEHNETLNGRILEIIFFVIFICGMIMARNQVKYAKLFGENIVPNFMEMAFENARHSRDEKLTEQIEKNYQVSEFDSGESLRLILKDHISCSSEDTKIDISNVWVHKIPGDERGILFFGLFAQTDSVKPVEQIVKISKNKLNKKKSKVDMDSSDFEEIFDIYAEDKIYAMRILTTDVMMLLLDFYEKYEMKFEIILKEQKIFLRFYTGKIFEKKLFRNPMKKKNLFIYYSIMEFVIELTKSINRALEQIEL